MRYYQLMKFKRTKTDEGIVYSKDLFTIYKSKSSWRIEYDGKDTYRHTYLPQYSYRILDEAIELVCEMLAFPESY